MRNEVYTDNFLNKSDFILGGEYMIKKNMLSIIFNVCFVLIFSVSFIVFDYVSQADITLEMENIALDKSEFNYREYMRLKPTGIKNGSNMSLYLKEFISELNSENTVISVTDFYLELKPELGYVEGFDICLSNTPPRYPLYEGNYPTQQQLETDNGYAVISYSRKKDVYLKNGREYINFNGEEFEVTGYLSKFSDWLVYNGVLLFCGENNHILWECMADFLESGWLDLNVESDNPINYSANIDEIKTLAYTTSENAFIVEYVKKGQPSSVRDVHIEYSKVPTDVQKKYACFIYIFMSVLIGVFFELYFTKKHIISVITNKNEYKPSKIMAMIYKKLFLFAIVAVVLGKTLECIYIYISDGYIALNSTLMYYNFVIILIYLIITLVLAGVFSIVKLILSSRLYNKTDV